jgi:diketogulonate reductase-like aldo/keto reductase
MEHQLLQRPIPSTGELLPVIGLGTWQAFDVEGDPASRGPLADVLRVFVERGGTLVDSSPMYGRAEQVIGDLAVSLGIQQRLFIATKVWIEGRKAGIRQMEESMQKLRTGRVDLMQVHNLVDVRTHLETLDSWKREGRVRHVGVTHYAASSHDAVARVIEAHPLDVVQINYSAVEREAERRVLPLARERGVAVLANRPFVEGALLRRLRGVKVPAWANEIGCSTWPQLLLKFIVSHPAITCVIPATSNPAHMRDNMFGGTGPLPDDSMRERIARTVAAA